MLSSHSIHVVFFSAICLIGLSAQAELKAGAYVQDITPTEFPVIVNGNFTEGVATKANDPISARAVVLDDGGMKIAIVVVDSCMLPRELLDDAKGRAQKATGIPVERMLISATHTHSAPSSMGCLGSDADEKYVKVLPGLLAQAIEKANARLAPAKVGFAVVNDAEHTATRRWIFRPDRMRNDPFGELTVRANMHPGHQSPDAIGPTGPVDPGLSIVSIQHADGRPLALLANYSMHYVGAAALSADYYGKFAEKVGKVIGADREFVGIMSQGTSGDAWLADYSKPKPDKRVDIDTFAEAMVGHVGGVYKSIEHKGDVTLGMAESTLKLRRRVPDEERLKWAKERVAALAGQKPKAQADIYAREAVFLNDEPARELKLQAVRIGDVAIAAIPCEVYALTGLKLKAQSPLPGTFNMSLANGSEGYIPPPEQHKLGGYTTWPARTAALEAQAEPKIVEATLKLLEQVAGKARREVVYPAGPYAQAVLASRPAGYYRLSEMAGPRAYDASGNKATAVYEAGVVFHLTGPEGAAGLTGDAKVTPRAAHFAGGRVMADVEGFDAKNYTVEFWFWNGLAETVRPVTAYLFSRGPAAANEKAPGDHLGIGGTYEEGKYGGRLILFTGNERNVLLAGKTALEPRTWYHVALTRSNGTVTAYLNGRLELAGDAELTSPATSLFFGGRCDNFANLEGKLAEAAVFTRALAAEEIAGHFKVAAFAEGSPAVPAVPAAMKRASEPRSPAESMKSLHLPPDLAIELVASEPLVVDPVAIDWGADGRLWVVEMADYPYGMDGKGKAGGRVKFLESTKDDGRYDKATLFADGLRMPTGIIAWRKGVIVTAAPDVVYLEDTDGDGKADKSEVLYTGFKTGNPQLRVNGLRWGLDNWLYCANGWSAGVVKSNKTRQTLDLKGCDLRIRPDTGEMELVAGVSQFGREPDDAGRWFGTDNAHPLFHYTLEPRYLKHNPHATYGDVKNQLLPLPLPPVYPKSPFARRYIGLDHHGHFTSACGISIYRDEVLFPRDASLHALICEPVHNLVQHQVLAETGATFAAKRLDGEAGADFLAGEDPWFRPVMTRSGPDGALWVVDFYRYMIEHPDWLNKEGKEAFAPFFRDGDDKGRIYRVYPKGARLRPIPNFADATNEQLVAALGAPAGHTRDLAQRMLVWRADPAADRLLEALFRDSKDPRARLHALATLAGLDQPKLVVLLAGLIDSDPAVRAHAIRLSEGRDEPALMRTLCGMTGDGDAFVRLQLALALGQMPGDEVGAALAKLVPGHAGDPLFAAAIASGAVEHRAALIAAVLSEVKLLGTPLYDHLLSTAVGLKDDGAMARFLDAATGSPKGLARYLDVLAARGMRLESIAVEGDRVARVRRAIVAMSGAAADPAQSLVSRLAGAELLGRLPDRVKEDLAAVASLLSPQTAPELQLASVRAAVRTGDPAVPELLLRDWSTHSPALRSAIVDALFPREPWALALANSPAARTLDFPRRQRLLNHGSAKVKAAAKANLSDSVVNADRQKVIDANAEALTLPGDAKRGLALFGEHCATCHRVGGSPVGHDLGPNLLTMRDWSKENLLAAILDPDRTVEPRYFAYTATLAEGTTFTGLLTAESAGGVTIKTLDSAEHVVPRASLKSLVSTNHSLMPQGFESALEPQQLADLMAFVQNPTNGN